MEILPTSLLVLIAAGFAAMGMLGIAAPVSITRQFGIESLTDAGRNEVRGVYGGFGLAVASALWVALWQPEHRLGICLAAGLSLAGMAGGRVISAAIDRSIERFPATYLAIETIGAFGLLYSGGIL